MSHPKAILLKLEANARKSLSQNFLTSPHWADLLTNLAVKKESDEVWEIGPGLGALTSVLLKKAKGPVRAFEYDRKLAAFLRAEHPTLDLIEGDVMKADFETLSAGKRISVLSNLPYHLSSAIFFKLVDIKPRIVSIVLTFQKEFAERLIALPRTENYSSLSVMAQLHFSIQSVGILPPGAFYPAPSISSEALMFEPKTGPESPQHLSWVVRSSFQQRRKKLSNNLKAALPKAPVEEILRELGINPDARPEELTKEQYVRLAEIVRPHVCADVCQK